MSLVMLNEVTFRVRERVLLHRVGLDIRPGEVVALMGPGSSGKSTLLQVIAGVRGQGDGEKLRGTLNTAKVTLVRQHLAMMAGTVESYLRARQPGREALTPLESRALVMERCAELGMELQASDLEQEVVLLPPPRRAQLAIVGALLEGADVLAIDEPTAQMNDEEAAPLLEMIARARAQCSVVWVSHHQRRVREVADRVGLVVAGQLVALLPTAEFFSDDAPTPVRHFVRTGGCPRELIEAPEVSEPIEDLDSSALRAICMPQPRILSEVPAPAAEGAVPPAPKPLPKPAAAPGARVLRLPVRRDRSYEPEPESPIARRVLLESLPRVLGLKARSLPPEVVAPRDLGWLIPGVLGGAPRPGLHRDDLEDLQALAELGVAHLIDMRAEVTPPPREPVPGLRVHHFPVVDMEVPELTEMVRWCVRIEGWLTKGKPVVVHCEAGLGRTGTFLASFLIYHGVAPDQAIKLVRRVRSGSIQSDAQTEFLFEFERWLNTSIGPRLR
ncbi:ATP-binding cassette domain-containing protein [Lujinxingia sediminis]|uniref:ATP-binding cassette domain-containing protein n=1 Tax=Lujinxingia sediminis TaxID=2480984 RepID=A0ABY0CRT1_9DELT|nr:ATP-binding cassette domain-containing protein [Lujinxingia sediminis]RVU43523.1 ATP-binding cassette domain-containing protein [Lujinxingia sediminis]